MRVPPKPFVLDRYFRRHSDLVNEFLTETLPVPRSVTQPDLARLYEAMRYSVFAGGKRIRPILVLAACEAVGGKIRKALPVAASIEMIHTYSLIHDDLPAMDNASLRRGKVSCHKAFGETTAILAGDALLALAFETLARNPGRLPPSTVLEITRVFAEAAGPLRMVAGQALDMAPSDAPMPPTRLEDLEEKKTGALIAACLTGGALAGGAKWESSVLKNLAFYGSRLGLAFQIMDDVLDASSTPEELGKEVGQDARHKKSTFVTLYGIEGARNKILHLTGIATRRINDLGAEATPLRAIADWVVDRPS